MKILICYGTRPEVIKLSLLSKKLSKDFAVYNVFTSQHTTLYNDVKDLIETHYRLSIEEHDRKNIVRLYSKVINEMDFIYDVVKPDLVIVQGDTLSSYCAAFVAFLRDIKVGHVEAGLRTFDFSSPFPEEFNRQVVSKTAYFNWCPTKRSVLNLNKEYSVGNILNKKIIYTGNTIVDFINERFNMSNLRKDKQIIITLHRRENKELFKGMLLQINKIAENNKDYNFIFPVHPNPNIRQQVSLLSGNNIKIVDPMGYDDFINIFMNSTGAITDSGGIQEEAVCLKKKVLICRNATERQETIDVGIGKLVGYDILENFNWLIEDIEDKNFTNPYGDGNACEKIIESIKEEFYGQKV